MNTLKRTFFCCALSLLVAASPTSASAQGRGGGGGGGGNGGGGGSQQPASALYFTYQGAMLQVDQNGQQSTAISRAVMDDLRLQDDSGAVLPIPSSHLYAGQRWYLWIAARDLDSGNPQRYTPNGVRVREVYVGIPGSWQVRLTDLWNLYGLLPNIDARLCWSGDNEDLFISFIAHNSNPDDLRTYIVQIPFLVNSDGPIPAFDLDAAGAVRIDVPPDTIWHSWAPDNLTVLYQSDLRVSESAFLGQIYRYTLGDAEHTLVWSDDQYTGGAEYQPQWSPDLDPVTEGYQGKIAFTRFRSTFERDILTIPASAFGLLGTEDTQVMLTGRSRAYSLPHWQPSSGSELAARDLNVKGSDSNKWAKNVTRVNVATGSTTNLTSNLDQVSDKTIIAWRPVR